MDSAAALCEAEAWAHDVDLVEVQDRMHEEHMALALWDELRTIRRKWHSDQVILRGALQLLKEAGIAAGSSELIAAAERFDLPSPTVSKTETILPNVGSQTQPPKTNQL